jgi:serine/threonine-protein kinase
MNEPNHDSTPPDDPGAIDTPAAAARVFGGLHDSGEGSGEEGGEFGGARPPRIDGYEIVERVGEGGQGRIWIARAADDSSGARIGIKVLRYSTRGFPRRYWQELEALSNLRIEGLARMIASGISDGLPWIAFEFVEGDDFTTFGLRASQREIVAAVASLADTLAEIHAAGFVHRDVKPGNVIVRARDGAPVLIDFGLACRIADQEARPVGAGTPEYMSPEQARGEACSPASDQWSLAATAMVALTGEAPHRVAATAAEQLELARSAMPRRIGEVAPTLPTALAEAIDRALQRDPAERFADCRAFAAALRGAPRSSGRIRPLATAVGVGVVASAALLWWMWRPPGLRTLAVGDYPKMQLGASVRVIGDLDADGLPEVLVGAPLAPGRIGSSWRSEAGELHIYNGRAIAGREKPAPHVLIGPREGGQIGITLVAPGDLDGDGVADFGASMRASPYTHDSVLLAKGTPALAAPGRTDLASHPAVEIAIDANQGPIHDFEGADLDGDGCSDAVIGESALGVDREGCVKIVYGSREFFERREPRVVHWLSEGQRGLGASGAVARDAMGKARFLIVGAPLGSSSSGDRGEVVVFSPSLRPLCTLVGGRADEWFGIAVDGEVCGDGQDAFLRIAIGACGIARAEDDSGQAYLVEIPITRFDVADWKDPIDVDGGSGVPFVRARKGESVTRPTGHGELLGLRVALLPNGWAVSAPRADSPDADTGRVDVVERGRTTTLRGLTRGEQLGYGLDLWRGDGQTVLLLGAPEAGSGAMGSSGAVRMHAIER